MSGPVVREQDVLLSGTLLKQSRFLGQWRSRWMVLTSQFLLSYEYQGQETVGQPPTEFLTLKDCATVRSAEDEVGREHAFKVEGGSRTFMLVASSKLEKEAWIGAVGKAMVKRSGVMLDD